MTVLAGRIGRRGFLTGTAAIAASAWLLGPAALGPGRNGLERLASGRGAISVGFVEGAGSLAEATGRRALPAASIAPDTAAFAGQLARLEVQGLASRPVAAGDESLRSVLFDALLLPPGTSQEPVTFHAWSLSRGPRLSHSGRVSFSWSAGPDPLIGFRLAVARGEPAAGGASPPAASPAVALLDGRTGGRFPKLRRGLYLLALEPGVWDVPTTVPTAGDAAWRRQQSVVVAVRRDTA